MKLAKANQGQGHTFFFGLLQFLQTLYQRIRTHRKTTQ